MRRQNEEAAKEATAGLTLREVREALDILGVRVRRLSHHDNEIQVKLTHAPEAAAYYTDDPRDALDTGVAIWRESRRPV